MSAARKTKTKKQPADFITLAKNPTLPEPPDCLSDEAKEHWRELIPIVIADDWTETANDFFACYCSEFARWQAAEQEIKKTGPVVKSPSGYPIVNPYVSIARKSQELMLRMAKCIDIPYKHVNEWKKVQ